MRLKSLIFALTFATVGLASVKGASGQVLFTPEERDGILRFWSHPDRYMVSLPSDALENGIWQVRLTVAGSQWLWNYQKGKKVPPNQTVQMNGTPQEREWEAWVQARIDRDRWEALQKAQELNESAIGQRIPSGDKTIPASAPKDPGPAPTSLIASIGNPPKFAEAAVPMQHDVRFEDFSVSYRDNHRPGNPRYAYYRYSQGVGDAGIPVKTFPEERINRIFEMAGIGPAEAKVMNAVSLLEGGFDSVNTYDTGFVSIGFIQFACLKEGGGSLGAMLRQYKEDLPDAFQRDFRTFGLDVTEDGKLAALDLTTGAELTGPEAAQEIIDDKRLVAVFQRAGQLSDSFIAAQVKSAKQLYFPGEDAVTVNVAGKTLTGKIADFIKSEAGLATLMDRKVNTGKLDPLPSILSGLASQINANSLADLIPFERTIVASLKYRKDYLTDMLLSQPAQMARAAQPNQSRGGMGRSGRGGGGKGSVKNRKR